MPKTFVGDGSTIDFIAESDVAAGSIVVLGDVVGVAKFAVAAGQLGGLTLRGIFDIVKDPSTNIAAGTPLYWSTISLHVVKTAASHPLLGKAVADAPPGTSIVRVLLTQ
jgi:predicted RecA/RadA family phage recombinase